MAKYTEVIDKLSDLIQQKQKLSRQVMYKEEKLEVETQKVDSLRYDIRKVKKLRRELENRVVEAIAETSKERKLRECTEEYCKRMQERIGKIRQRFMGQCEYTHMPFGLSNGPSFFMRFINAVFRSLIKQEEIPII